MDRMIQEERLSLWYEAMKNVNVEEADAHRKIIEAYPRSFRDPKLERLFKLFVARHHLMLKQHDLAETVLSEMAPHQQEGDYRFNYYYHFFCGILAYDRKHYNEAIRYFLKAEPIVTTIGKPIELAEFSYKLASVYHRTYHLVLSIEYAQQAFHIFRKQSVFLRMAHCENVIALNYLDMKEYREAERHLGQARRYAAKVKHEEIKMIILHNYGAFYSNQDKPKIALTYLSQAYELLEANALPLKIQNLFLLAKNYFKTGQTEKARRILNRAITLAKEQDNHSYSHHFAILKAKFLEPERLEKAYQAAIGYLNTHERWEYVLEYGEELAALYRKEGAFKEACECYTLAIEAKRKMDRARGESQ